MMKSRFTAIGILLGSCLLFTTLASCDKDPEVITEIVTIRDMVVVVDTFTIVETIFQSIPDTATTFILVRHAETTGSGSNPNLSTAGQARADELARILAQVNLNAVYTTDFNRTRQTAQPVADSKGLVSVVYDPFAPQVLIDEALLAFPKGIVLVVGHSNTTPDMLNVVTGTTTFQDIPESEYDNLFIAQVSRIGDASVIHMKYGL